MNGHFHSNPANQILPLYYIQQSGYVTTSQRLNRVPYSALFVEHTSVSGFN